MRWIKLTALALMLLLPLALVSGQAPDKRDLLCSDLEEADCQILLQNDAAMDGVSSFAFDMSMAIDIGAQELTAMAIAAEASGGMSFAAEGMQALQEMETAFLNIDAQAMLLSDDLIATLDAFLVGMTAEIGADLQITSQDGVDDMSLRLLIKDGVLALNASAFAEATGQSMGGMEWLGIDATGLFSLLMSQADMPETMPPAMDMTDVDEAMSAQTITRLADSEINGAPMAVFEVVQNTDQLLGMLDTETTAAMGESAALNATMRQYIGLEDFYTHRSEVVLNTMDEASMLSMDMSVTMNFTDFNLPVAVEIPQDAFVLPLEFLLMQTNS